jgi:hypothetical protein
MAQREIGYDRRAAALADALSSRPCAKRHAVED